MSVVNRWLLWTGSAVHAHSPYIQVHKQQPKQNSRVHGIPYPHRSIFTDDGVSSVVATGVSTLPFCGLPFAPLGVFLPFFYRERRAQSTDSNMQSKSMRCSRRKGSLHTYAHTHRHSYTHKTTHLVPTHVVSHFKLESMDISIIIYFS